MENDWVTDMMSKKETLRKIVRFGTKVMMTGIASTLFSSNSNFDENRFVKEGGKVIALAYDDGIGIDEPIYRGTILTVGRFNGSSYTFEEYPPRYCPYLGEEATRWYNAKNFLPVNDTSKRIVEYLNAIDQSSQEIFRRIINDINSYRPVNHLHYIKTKHSIEQLTEEYESLIMNFVPLFCQQEIKDCEQRKVEDFIEQMYQKTPEDRFSLELDWIQPRLQAMCDDVKTEISACHKRLNIVSNDKTIENIRTCFRYKIYKKEFEICNNICEQYMHYIIKFI